MAKGNTTHRVSLQRFAKGKKSTHDYKQKRKVQAFKKSKALSKYSKLCAREGIQSERVRISNTADDNVDPPSEAPSSAASTTPSQQEEEARKPTKMSRFHKAQLQAKQLAEEKAKRREEAQKRTAEKEQAIAKRKRLHRQLSKKTRAGQPVMGNKVQFLLEKIKQQKVQERQA